MKSAAQEAAGQQKESRASRTCHAQQLKNDEYPISNDENYNCRLSSSSSTKIDRKARGQKRSLSFSYNSNNLKHSNKPQLAQSSHQLSNTRLYHPIEHWAATLEWPEDFAERNFEMSNAISHKRKSETTHRTDLLERFAKYGVFMGPSDLIQKSSLNLCDDLKKGDRKPTQYTLFPSERLSAVLMRIQCLNETRLQRDITPWVVPSAELLFFCGELADNIIGEELNAEWIRCATMGSTRPKPDYVAGLRPGSFTEVEMQKLKNYASPLKPVYFTPSLCFPFLICEAKAGEQGMHKAQRQNIHSASIAVRAVIELFKAAFGGSSERVKALSGQVLVLTVSHDHEKVCIDGHYAIVASETDQLQFYSHQIATTNLRALDSKDRFMAYNFVRNVYDQFASEHQQRIQHATEALPRVQEPIFLSVTASGMASEDVLTQLQNDPELDTLGLPASASQYKKEVNMLMEQMEQQKMQEREQLERQMEQQREQMERQMEQQREQMERQMELQMDRQMEQQRELLAQNRELISLLTRRSDQNAL